MAGDEQLEVGGPASSARTRRLLPLALGVLLVLVVVLALLPGRDPVERPGPPPLPLPSPTVPSSDPPSPPSPAATGPSPTTSPRATERLDPPGPGSSGRLLVQDESSLLQIDLASGSATRTETRVASAPGAGGVLVAEEDAVLVASLESGAAELLGDDGSVTEVSLPGADAVGSWVQVLPGPPGQVWVSSDRAETGRLLLRRATLDGRTVATTQVLDAPRVYTLGGDGGSGVVVATLGGGSWVVDENGTRAVPGGTPVAVGPRVWVQSACDDQLDCGLVVRDLSTGAERGLATVGEVAVFASTGVTSPDGRWWAQPDGEGLAVRDLGSGEVVAELALSGYFPSQPPVWSPDGRYLFVVDGSAVRRLEPASARVDTVDVGEGSVRRIGWRG